MSATQILSRAESLGVRVRLNGDGLHMDGPKEARDAIRPEVVAHKPEIVAHLRAAANDADDCTGALRSRGGGLYLPWGPYLDPASVNRLRAELVGMIEALAVLEAWLDDCRDDVLARAIHGPLSDLMPNLHYFRQRLDAAHAEAGARKAAAARSWPLTGFDDRRMI